MPFIQEDGPFGRGVLRDIPMNDPARADFQDDQPYGCGTSP